MKPNKKTAIFSLNSLMSHTVQVLMIWTLDVFYKPEIVLMFFFLFLFLMQEGPLRPVLECIDLLSDSEDEGCSSLPNTVSFFYFFYFKQIIWLFNPFNSYVNILFFLKTHYFFQL